MGVARATDPTAAQAILDLTTACDDAAGRTRYPVSRSGTLGGQALAPGPHRSTSDLSVTSGDVTLDARGDADAVFIFQAASTATTTAGRQAVLANGAKAAGPDRRGQPGRHHHRAAGAVAASPQASGRAFHRSTPGGRPVFTAGSPGAVP